LRFCQYIDLFIDKYSLRVFSKKKSIIDLDDLYLLLYTHWVLDNSIFKNKRQRIQVAIDLFTIAFFDCQLYFLFDTRVKFDDSDNSNIFIDKIVIAIVSELRKNTKDIYINKINNSKNNSNNNTRKSIDTIDEVDSNSNNNSDNDFDLSCNYSKNCETDNDCYTELEETRSFLYRYFSISIIVNQIAKKSNLIFIKTTLLYIKKKIIIREHKQICISRFLFFLSADSLLICIFFQKNFDYWQKKNDLLFSLFDYFISLTIYDNAFEATFAKNVENIFRIQISFDRKSLMLK